MEPGRSFLLKYPAIRCCAVNLINPLCQVDADDGNFLHGCLLLCW